MFHLELIKLDVTYLKVIHPLYSQTCYLLHSASAAESHRPSLLAFALSHTPVTEAHCGLLLLSYTFLSLTLTVVTLLKISASGHPNSYASLATHPGFLLWHL